MTETTLLKRVGDVLPQIALEIDGDYKTKGQKSCT